MNELTELLETKMQSFLKDAALQVQNGNKAAGNPTSAERVSETLAGTLQRKQLFMTDVPGHSLKESLCMVHGDFFFSLHPHSR